MPGKPALQSLPRQPLALVALPHDESQPDDRRQSARRNDPDPVHHVQSFGAWRMPAKRYFATLNRKWQISPSRTT